MRFSCGTSCPALPTGRSGLRRRPVEGRRRYRRGVDEGDRQDRGGCELDARRLLQGVRDDGLDSSACDRGPAAGLRHRRRARWRITGHPVRTGPAWIASVFREPVHRGGDAELRRHPRRDTHPHDAAALGRLHPEQWNYDLPLQHQCGEHRAASMIGANHPLWQGCRALCCR